MNWIGNRVRTGAAAAAAAWLVVAGAQAQAQDWEAIEAAAAQEGKVILWTAKGDPLMERVLAAFSEKYPGIATEYQRVQSNLQATRIDEELAAGLKVSADVLISSEGSWIASHYGKGNLQVPTGPGAQAYPPREKDGPYIVGIDPVVIMYNTQQITTPPADWDTLATEEYKGRFGLVNAVPTVFKVFYHFISEKMGVPYLEKLGTLEPQVATSTATLTQAIAAGELVWSPYGQSYLVEDLKKLGAPIDYVMAQSGTIANVQYAASFKQAAHPNAGMLLLDFLLSAEGQAALNGANAGVSPLPGIEGTLQYDLSKIEHLDTSKYSKEDLASFEQLFNTTIGRK